MASDYETCRSTLERLVDGYATRGLKRNEATTRLQLIDELFFNCLGWDKEDSVLEEPYGRDYADYTFMAPRRVLIVEAKKEGDYFEIPAGRDRLEYSISALMRDYPNLKLAIEQATGYCQSRGVPFGVVSNGHQIVAFVATRNDGLPPFEGKALVFPSLDFMLSHFHEFWQALSKPAIEQKKLYARLIGDILPELPPKLSSNIAGYPGVVNRNVFQTDLQIISDLVIEDITRSHELEADFLEECYSQSGALSQFALLSKSILQARYAALFDSDTSGPTPVPAVTKEGISPELFAESLSRRPILLIGDVGVGKSTFIRHLIKVDAVQVFENAISLYIDLGSQATLSMDLRIFILDEITKQLREDHQVDIEERNFVRGVYHGQLVRFSKSIYGDLRESDPTFFKQKEIEFLEQKLNNREEFLKSALEHISRGRRKQIIVFLDNADQRSDDIQQQAFLIAQELAAHWPATVFVALRPETYFRSLKIGALSGYHPKAFTISPPRIDHVIDKRLNFALKITSGEIPLQAINASVQVQLTKLDSIIRIFLDSLRYNRALEGFIDNIAGGNVRLALDLIKGFFGSGHVDTQKFIDIYDESGSYYVPLHEFLRAVIYGDAKYYEPDRSPVANLFDVSYVDPKEHFLLPSVIGLLGSSNNPSVEEGFIETSKIYEHLQALGFTPEQIDAAIIRGHNKKLIETGARRIPHPGQIMPQTLRATTVGLYHIGRLSHQFSYIDAIIVDTPVFDPAVRALIRDVSHIEQRIERVEIFRQYLDNQWACFSNTRAEAAYNWSAASANLQKEISHIKSRS